MDIPNFKAAIRDADSGSGEARLVASIALGRVRDRNQPQAIEALGRLSRDPLEEVRAQALEGIAEQMRGEAHIPQTLIDQGLSDPSPRVRSVAVQNLILKGPGKAPLLIPMLEDPDPSVRATICQILGDTGPEGAAFHLARRLDDPVPFVTEEAALALAELGDERGESILLKLLDRGHQQAIDAAYALGRIGKNTACSQLRQIVQKTFVSTDLRAMAAAALLSCGGADGRPVLEKLLKSRRSYTKHVVLCTLARLPVSNMASSVAELLNHSKPDIISAAIETLYILARLDKEEVIELLESKRTVLKGELGAELGDRILLLRG